MKFIITEEERIQIKNLYNGFLLEQENENPTFFSQVIEVPNKTKDEIFDKIKLWLVESFKDFNSVSQMDDKSTGVFILKPSMKFVSANPKAQQYWDGFLDYTMKIIVKDNKFKVDLNNFNHKASDKINSVGMKVNTSLGLITDKEIFGSKNKYDNLIWSELKNNVKTYSEKMIDSIKNYVLSNKTDDFQP